MSDTLLRSIASPSASAASPRSRREPRGPPRRAPWHHRAERLRQDHADQLHLRIAAQRRRGRSRSTGPMSPACPRIRALGWASRAASRSRGHSRACRWPRISRYRSSTSRTAGSLHTADVRGEALAILEQMGLGGQGRRALDGSDAGRSAQAGAGARAGGAAVAADLDEAMAGLSSVEVDEVLGNLLGSNSRGITIIMVEHIMRAIMRFSERVVCLDAGRSSPRARRSTSSTDPNVQRVYLGA